MKKPDKETEAHNAAIDQAAAWLRAYAHRLRGQPAIGGVLLDQLADEVLILRIKPIPQSVR